MKIKINKNNIKIRELQIFFQTDTWRHCQGKYDASVTTNSATATKCVSLYD